MTRQGAASTLDLYTIGEVAAILGVSPHTIRAWERRHGVVKPLRTRARQRRYRAEDVELLREIKKAVDVGGMTLKLASRAVREGQHVPAPRVPRPRRPARRQEAARATDEMWRAVADVMPELIMVVNSGGLIVEGNVAAAKTFGTTRQRLAGRAFSELVDPFDRAKAVLLYRPVLRSVRSWELNLLSASGSRLFSFQTWPVVREGETMLTLVATEMFAGVQGEPSTTDTRIGLQAPIEAPSPELAPASMLQGLLDQLPIGLGISTVGREPRMVYANDRFVRAIETPRSRLTGTRLRDVVRDRAAAQAIQSALDAKSAANLRAVRVQSSSLLHPRGRRLDIAMRPLQSQERKVTSMLIVVKDVTADTTWRARLEKLIGERQTDPSGSARQLADLGLEYLSEIGPHADFAVVIEPVTGRPGPTSVVASSRWTPAPRQLLSGRAGALIHEGASLGRKGELDLREGRDVYHIAVRPFRINWDAGGGRRHGVVAWRSPVNTPLPPEELAAIESFLPSMTLAADMLNARTEALRKASQLDAVAGAASVVATSGDAAVAAQFVERLAEAMGAESAAIGTVEGTRFVVGAGRGMHGGDRVHAPRHVLDAVRGAEPVARTVPGAHGSPRRGGSSSRDAHLLAVPLIVDHQVRGVVSLSRRGSSPFDPDEVRLVQILSSVALLALALVRGKAQA